VRNLDFLINLDVTNKITNTKNTKQLTKFIACKSRKQI